MRMQEFVLVLDYVRETKRTVVYGTDEEGAEVTTLYIAKSAMRDEDGPYPESITIGVSEAI